MVIIGEKLNSSIPKTREALDARDEAFVRELARAQAKGGADFLDVNAAMCANEQDTLLWAAGVAAEAAGLPLMVDSPSPAAIRSVYERMELPGSIINSVTLEEERLMGVLPLVKQYGTGVVAMPISPEGMPHGIDGRVENARRLVALLNGEGIENGRIYVDIVAEAAAADWEAPGHALEAARILRAEYPDLHLVAGLSNVSFGLPKRAAVNRAFACFCVQAGVDALIMDSANADLVLTLRAAGIMAGEDEYCLEYLGAYRALEQ